MYGWLVIGQVQILAVAFFQVQQVRIIVASSRSAISSSDVDASKQASNLAKIQSVCVQGCCSLSIFQSLSVTFTVLFLVPSFRIAKSSSNNTP